MNRMPLACLLSLTAWQTAIPVAAVAQTLRAVGDGANLWVIVDVEGGGLPTVSVLHHGPGDPDGELRLAKEFAGLVPAPGVTASHGAMWLFSDGVAATRARTVTVGRSPLDGSWRYAVNLQPSMPAGGTLRAIAAGNGTAWALVRIASAEAMERFTDGVARRARRSPTNRGLLRVALDLPPPPTTQSHAAELEPAASQPAPDPASVPDQHELPTNRLLALRQGVWQVFDLPDDWPTGRPAKMAMHHGHDAAPVLIARGPASTRELWMYQWQADQWHKQAYELRGTASAFAVLSVTGQLVLAERLATEPTVAVALSVLRKDGATEVGTLEIMVSPESLWAVAPLGTGAALIVQPAGSSADNLQWAGMDLMGRPVAEPARLRVRETNHLDSMVGMILMVMVLVLATLIMLMFWRRDLQLNRLSLPPPLALGDLGRRSVAGMLDMAPGFIGAMWHYRLGPAQLLAHWPGSAAGMTWEGIQPAVIVIGIFLVYTGVGEGVSGRTIGKAMTGLRVVTLDGGRPRMWQLLVRNGLKAFDLIAWPLLILPMIGPYRQRLGDMVARTVVVMAAPPESEEEG